MLAILVTLALAVPAAEEADWIDLFLEGSRALEQGELTRAQRALERALVLQPRHAPTAWQLAGAMARAGDTAGALDRLESVVAWGGGEAALLLWDPDLASLRAEARFGTLLEELRDREREEPRPEHLVAELASRIAGHELSASPRAEVVALQRGWDTFLFDLRGNELLAVLDRPNEHPRDVSLSPDGRWAVTTGSMEWSGSRTHYMRVFDAVTGDLVTELEPAGWLASTVFSRSGNRMLAFTSSGPMQVWETNDWTLLGKVKTGRRTFSFSPDGTRVLYVSPQDKKHSDVVFWDVDEQRAFRRHEDLESPWAQPDFSADGELALAKAFYRVHVYDAEDGRELCQIEAEGGHFREARFLGATGEVVTLDEELQLTVWNARSGQRSRSFRATGFSEELYPGYRLESSPDGSQVLVAEWGSSLQVFDAATDERSWAAERSRMDDLLEAHFTPDGSRILVARYFRPSEVRDARSGEVLATLPDPRSRSFAHVHPRREELWIGREEGSLLRIDAVHGRELDRFQPGNAPVRELCFTPKGERLATIDLDGVLRLIDTKSGEVLTRIPGAASSGPDSPPPHLEYAADGSAFLIGATRETVRIHDAADGALRCEIEVGQDLQAISWRGDGGLLATDAPEGRVRLFDTRTGEPVESGIDIEAEVTALAFEPRGDRLWVGDDASTVHVLDVAEGTLIRTLDLQDLDSFGTVEVGSITFREKDELAITASIGFGGVAAWDPPSGERVWAYTYPFGNESPLFSAFGRSGERVYVWGQGPATSRIVSDVDGSTLLDLSTKELHALLPLADERRLAALGPEGLEVIETESGERRWVRTEVKGGGWLLTAPTRHVDGTREALEQLHLVLPERSCPLDALAAALLDPKRVRAGAEGVDLAPARIPAMPELDWVSHQPRVVRLGEDQEPPEVTLVARCSEGVSGFELSRDGERQRLSGEAVSPTERRLTFQLARPAGGDSIDYRWRSVGTKGVMSRALHLTVELER